jgi:hypothetical protein
MILLAGVTMVLFIISSINLGYALHGRVFGAITGRAVTPVSLGLGFAAFAVIGAVVWSCPVAKNYAAAILLIATNSAAAIYNWPHRRSIMTQLSKDAFGLAIWCVVSVSLFLVAHLNIPRQENLYDGPYVYKLWTTPVKIQVMTGDFPADDVLPALVAEYMARGTSFRAVRPLAPGQEVTNRPFLQALQYLPIRVLQGPLDPAPKPYPTISYVGTTWPDTTVLVSDASYAFYLAVAIPLNAALLVAVWSLIAFFRVPYRRLILVTCCALSPYFLLHSIFTWPKNLAAFYIVSGILAFCLRYPLPVLGFFLGLAYWSHPYAGAFLVCFVAAAVLEIVRQHRFSEWRPFLGRFVYARDLAVAVGVIAATILPWIIWVKFIARIPPDMLGQVLRSADLFSQLWVRVQNTVSVFFPTFLLLPVFDAETFARTYVYSLSSAIGLITLLLLPWIIVRRFVRWQFIIFWLGLLPGFLIISVYGFLVAPFMHGWQAVWPGLLVVALHMAARALGKPILIVIALSQLALNTAVLGIRTNTIVNRPDSLLRYPMKWTGTSAAPNLGATVQIGNETRIVLFSSAPSKVYFSDVPAGTMLGLSIGVHPDVHALPGADETIFRVTARTNTNAHEVVFERALNVRNNSEDRKWIPLQIRLPPTLSGFTEVVLECDPGPAGNAQGDWCVWGSPAIIR